MKITHTYPTFNIQVLTFIRPGTMPGLLLSMIKELPFNQRSEEYMPLSRVQIYSAEDDSMSLNLFVYGEEAKQLTEADVTMTGEQINDYSVKEHGTFHTNNNIIV